MLTICTQDVAQPILYSELRFPHTIERFRRFAAMINHAQPSKSSPARHIRRLGLGPNWGTEGDSMLHDVTAVLMQAKHLQELTAGGIGDRLPGIAAIIASQTCASSFSTLELFLSCTSGTTVLPYLGLLVHLRTFKLSIYCPADACTPLAVDKIIGWNMPSLSWLCIWISSHVHSVMKLMCRSKFPALLDLVSDFFSNDFDVNAAGVIAGFLASHTLNTLDLQVDPQHYHIILPSVRSTSMHLRPGRTLEESNMFYTYMNASVLILDNISWFEDDVLFELLDYILSNTNKLREIELRDFPPSDESDAVGVEFMQRLKDYSVLLSQHGIILRDKHGKVFTSVRPSGK
jgi:hypothetical protein